MEKRDHISDLSCVSIVRIWKCSHFQYFSTVHPDGIPFTPVVIEVAVGFTNVPVDETPATQFDV